MPKYLITIPTRLADFNFERGDQIIDIGNPPREYTYVEHHDTLLITGDEACLSSLLSLSIKVKVECAPTPTPTDEMATLRAQISELNNDLISTTLSLDEARANANAWATKFYKADTALRRIRRIRALMETE